MGTGRSARAGMPDRTRGRTRGRARLLAVALTAVLTATGAASALPSAQAAGQPQVEVDDPRVSLGERIDVVGSGFESRQQVSVDVCGAPDMSARLTCSSSPTTLDVPISGKFSTALEVREPSGPCPCFVVVRRAGQEAVTRPVELLGHPVAERAQFPELVVDEARLEGVGGFDSWFTGSARAELVLELRNVGTAEARPTLVLDAGKTEERTRRTPLDDPGVDAVPVGESRTVTVPVELGSFPGGKYVVSGDVVVGDLHAPVSATAGVRPWGLLLLVTLAAVAVVLRRTGRTAVTAGAGTSHRSAGSRTRPRTLLGGPTSPGPAASPEPAAAAVPAPPAAPDGRGAGSGSAGRGKGLLQGNLAEIARVASGVSQVLLERARQAEARESREQREAARAEHTEAAIDARLDVLRASSGPVPEVRAVSRAVASVKNLGVRNVRAERVEPLVGPPRLERTPIDRTRLGGWAGELSTTAVTPVSGATGAAHDLSEAQAGPDEQETEEVLRAHERAMPPSPEVPARWPVDVPVDVSVSVQVEVPSARVIAPDEGAASDGGTSAPTGAKPAESVPAVPTPRRPDPLFDPLFDPLPPEALEEVAPPVAGQVAPEGAMAADLRERSRAADAAVVADALEAVRVHAGDASTHLPDPHAVVPPQRDRRAPKGGKRAAR